LGGVSQKNNFLVGLSCDGPAHLHDRYRVDKNGGASYSKVVAAASLLRRYGVPFNATFVINPENAGFPLDVYRFLTRELGAWRVQLISCVEPRSFRDIAPQHWDPADLPIVGTARARPGAEDSVVTPWSVDPEERGNFLCPGLKCFFRHIEGDMLEILRRVRGGQK
jgi:uncharacterized protein